MQFIDTPKTPLFFIAGNFLTLGFRVNIFLTSLAGHEKVPQYSYYIPDKYNIELVTLIQFNGWSVGWLGFMACQPL